MKFCRRKVISAQTRDTVAIEMHTGSFEKPCIADGKSESVRNCTRETITRHVSDRSYDFSLRLARIMYSRPLTAKQVLRSNVDISSNASGNKHLYRDRRFRPLSRRSC